MKKLIYTSIILIIIFIVGIALNNFNNTANEKINIAKTKDNIKNTNMLTMMLETESGTGIYEETTASTWLTDGYVFNAVLSKCENGGTLSWDNDAKKVLMESSSIDKCYIYFDRFVEPSLADICSGKNMANCIKENVYINDGDNGLYYHDGQGTYTNADQEAGDNSYRYAGANPNNYVCFGTDAETCPEDNLYRIIGLFNEQIKLIKADYANINLLGTNGDYNSNTYNNTSSSYYKGSLTTINTYYWNNNTGINTWSESNLNTINLNTNYWGTLSSEWQNLITTTTWKVGGNTASKTISSTVKNAYQNEIISPAESTTYSDEIGLMYVSDYGYAASPENWTTKLSNYNSDQNRNANWLFMGLYESTITRCSDWWYRAYTVNDAGNTADNLVNTAYAIRPVFYLKTNIQITSGDGTKVNPYRVVLF